MPELEPVVQWIRLSPTEVKEDEIQTSFVNQIELGKSESPKYGWYVERLFYPKNSKGEFKNVSGSDREIKEFHEMIDYAVKNKRKIVVKNRDRFCRDVAFFMDTMTDLNAHEVQVFDLAHRRFLDPNTMEDQFGSVVDGMVVTIGRDKTATLFRQKIEKGLPIVRPPYGYKIKEEGGIWIPKKGEVETVKKLFEMLSQGEEPKAIWVSLGLDYWKFWGIVNNKAYIGKIQYRKKHKDSKKNIIREEEIVYQGKHQPIVSQELWEKAHAALEQRRKGLLSSPSI